MPETRPGLSSKPVIKILSRMLIQWKKTKMALQRALFLSLIKSQNPFSKKDPNRVQAGGERGGRVAEGKDTVV